MEKISLIIPAYNEERRISNVLKVVDGHPMLSEIIVVNDGSTDNTTREIRKFKKIRLVELKKNSGKAYAVKKGVENAKYGIIMLLDADLINLRKRNITELAIPVLKRKADMTLGLRLYPLATMIHNLSKVDWLTGDRCMRREIIESLKIRKNTRYALEVLMNDFVISHNLKIKVVNFKNVTCAYKVDKVGLYSGLKGELKTAKEILKALPAERIILQIFQLSKQQK